MLFFLKSQQLHTQTQDNLERTCKTPHIHLRMMIVTTIWLLPESLISTTPNHSKKQTTVSNILSVVLFSACNYDCNILHKWSSFNSFKATAKYNKSLQQQQQQQASRSQFPTAHKICHVTPKKFCISSLSGLSRPPGQTLVPSLRSSVALSTSLDLPSNASGHPI